MRRFFDLNSTFFAVLFLFAFAMTWNGSTSLTTGHRFMAPSFAPDVQIAHGPTLPPDPWNVQIAHGPTLPPDPWNVQIAHVPTLPPDPWNLHIAHAPTLTPHPRHL